MGPLQLKRLKSKIITALMIICFVSPIYSAIAQEKEEVAYRLKWLFNVSVVGDLWADVNGHFAANGLKVAVKPGGPEKDAIKELELGRSQFGVASADQVIRAVSKGSPMVVLAQLFQTNPLPSVEGSIWTLFYEAACYVGVFVAGCAGLL